MKTLIKQSILILMAAIAFTGCNDDAEKVTITDEIIYQSSVYGIVLDQLREPVANATATFNGLVAITDQYGVYEFKDVSVGDNHNSIHITKTGYFDACRTFRATKDGDIHQQTELIPELYSYSFNAASGGTINHNEVELVFPSNGIVVDANSADYNGVVQVAVAYIDPSNADQMPGDLSGVDDLEELQALTSFGMVHVNLKGAAGQKLQIKEGNTVTMSAEIPADILSDAPSAIPMWHFDFTSGLWVEEGSATLSGSKYTAEVSHFSCWNYDVSDPSIILDGRLIDDNGDPIGSQYIVIFEEGKNSGGRGRTNADGTFGGRVAKGKVLNIYVYNSQCHRNKVLVKQVGPFNANTSIGDIVIPDGQDKFIAVKGEFKDCNGDPVTDGFVQVEGRYFFINNGKINGNMLDCGTLPTTLEYRATDRKGGKQSTGTVNVVNKEADFGTVSVCDSDVPSITIVCTNLSLNEEITPNVSYYFQSQGNQHYINGYSDKDSTSINLTYVTPSGVDEGTFAISSGLVQLPASATRYFWVQSSNAGTVTVSKDVANDQYYGTYTCEMTLDGSTTIETFTGSFRVNY